MADDISASIIPLHQPPKKRAKTGAERARAYRARKKAARAAALVPAPVGVTLSVMPVTSRTRQSPAAWLLTAAAFALAAIGITINGWFARSLGSTEPAGWLLLALGVAADGAALALPSCAAKLWRAGQRASAGLGWAVWGLTSVFALTAGLGFASQNITDVTLSRASRGTPAVTIAETALRDAMTARDRECLGGVGRYCRERESAVVDRRSVLDSAIAAVSQASDPQAQAAVRIVAWASFGALRPSAEDFSLLRLLLLALLPQIGGVLLLLGRSSR